MKLLRRFEQGVDSFLRKHPNFGLRNLMLYVVIGNAVIFLLSMMDRTGMLSRSFFVFCPANRNLSQ